MTILLAVLTGVLLMVTLAAAGYAWWYRTLYLALCQGVLDHAEAVETRAVVPAVVPEPFVWIASNGVRH